MKRILFVDDEPDVLSGLRNLLRKQSANWEMTFVGSGAAALEALALAPFDVIVSDMRMPKMDGAALLQRVLKDYPQIVRIVLSGQAEQEVARRLVHVAHQFVSKLSDGAALQTVIERACKLQELLGQPNLRQAVGEVKQLPVKPALYTRLVELLENPNSSTADVAAVIERDIGTSSKLLQVVNSAFFGLPSRVGDVRTAVSYLGMEMVKMLALSVEMRQSQGHVKPCPGFNIDSVQEHGLRSARIARKLLPDKLGAQDAFSAAMLQDAGKLVLMGRLPDVFARIVKDLRETPRHTISEIEMATMGVTHAEIGAYLLGIWGLPYGIVEGVAFHHAPSRAVSVGLDVPGAVHIGSALAEELVPQDPAKSVRPGVKLDMEYLNKFDLAKQLPAWRDMAKRELSGARASR
jgi:HD-like signal output (HDOD) protein